MEKMKRHAKFGHSKTANIERRNYEDLEKAREPSFRRRLRSQSPEKWMQRASRHPGMTRAYLAHKYGGAAFNADGTIKESKLDEAIKEAKEEGNTTWEKRLVLARTYKEY